MNLLRVLDESSRSSHSRCRIPRDLLCLCLADAPSGGRHYGCDHSPLCDRGPLEMSARATTSSAWECRRTLGTNLHLPLYRKGSGVSTKNEERFTLHSSKIHLCPKVTPEPGSFCLSDVYFGWRIA